MKHFLILCCTIACYFSVNGQTVRNITSEQDGNNINIHYDLTGLKEFQSAVVSILCETPAKKFVMRHVTGDVGDSVRGGLGKKIVWDVFKDIDTLSTAAFLIRVEKVNDHRTNQASSMKDYGMFLSRGWGAILSGGPSFYDGKAGINASLIAGYSVLPPLFIGLGLGYQNYHIDATDIDMNNSGMPLDDVANATDSFITSSTAWTQHDLTAYPVFLHLRYDMLDKKLSPYLSADIGTLLTGSVGYSATLQAYPAYDSIGYRLDGTSVTSNYITDNEDIDVQSSATLKNAFYFSAGAGISYHLNDKIALCLDLSYTRLQCEYEVNYQYLYYDYEYLDPAEMYGVTYDAVLKYNSRIPEDQLLVDSKTFSSINTRVGLIYYFR